MLFEIYSLMVLPPSIFQIWVLGTPVVGLFIEFRI